MKVLHVHTELQRGGIAAVMRTLALQQLKKGISVGICYSISDSPQEKSLAQQLQQKGVQIFSFPVSHVLLPNYSFRLAKVIKKFRPEILHLHGGTIGILGSIIGRLFHVPVIVYTEHLPCYPQTPQQNPFTHAPWIRWGRSLTANLSNITVAISKAVKNTLPK